MTGQLCVQDTGRPFSTPGDSFHEFCSILARALFWPVSGSKVVGGVQKSGLAKQKTKGDLVSPSRARATLTRDGVKSIPLLL